MTKELGREVARKAKVMTRREVIIKAIAKKITWQQAADTGRSDPADPTRQIRL